MCVWGGGGIFFYSHDAFVIGDHMIKKVIGVPLTGLTSPHVCACPHTVSGLPTSYVEVFFIFNDHVDLK